MLLSFLFRDRHSPLVRGKPYFSEWPKTRVCDENGEYDKFAFYPQREHSFCSPTPENNENDEKWRVALQQNHCLPKAGVFATLILTLEFFWVFEGAGVFFLSPLARVRFKNGFVLSLHHKLVLFEAQLGDNDAILFLLAYAHIHVFFSFSDTHTQSHTCFSFSCATVHTTTLAALSFLVAVLNEDVDICLTKRMWGGSRENLQDWDELKQCHCVDVSLEQTDSLHHNTCLYSRGLFHDTQQGLVLLPQRPQPHKCAFEAIVAVLPSSCSS